MVVEEEEARVVVVVVLAELTTASRRYKLSLLPSPQRIVLSPAHGFAHSLAAVRVEFGCRVFPHQHSLPYSRPK